MSDLTDDETMKLQKLSEDIMASFNGFQVPHMLTVLSGCLVSVLSFTIKNNAISKENSYLLVDEMGKDIKRAIRKEAGMPDIGFELNQ